LNQLVEQATRMTSTHKPVRKLNFKIEWTKSYRHKTESKPVRFPVKDQQQRDMKNRE